MLTTDRLIHLDAISYRVIAHDLDGLAHVQVARPRHDGVVAVVDRVQVCSLCLDPTGTVRPRRHISQVRVGRILSSVVERLMVCSRS